MGGYRTIRTTKRKFHVVQLPSFRSGNKGPFREVVELRAIVEEESNPLDIGDVVADFTAREEECVVVDETLLGPFFGEDVDVVVLLLFQERL